MRGDKEGSLSWPGTRCVLRCDREGSLCRRRGVRVTLRYRGLLVSARHVVRTALRWGGLPL